MYKLDKGNSLAIMEKTFTDLSTKNFQNLEVVEFFVQKTWRCQPNSQIVTQEKPLRGVPENSCS